MTLARYNFCTLFDKNFLYKGLSLYESLAEHCDNFHLWILCMDNKTYEILIKINPKNVTLLTLHDIENEELRKVKKTRSYMEYLWTLSSNLAWFVINRNPSLESIAYLDADLFFFSSPAEIYQEMKDSSVGIIPHRIGRVRKAKEESVGKYNVSMVIFKNDQNGLACLRWWKNKCNEWCYNRVERNRFGDQKYLDYFSELFDGVRVISSKGAGVAPWNVGEYDIKKVGESITVDKDKVIFFHFSNFKIYPPSYIAPYGPITVYNYTRYSKEKKLLYKPYADSLLESINKIKTIDKEFFYGITKRPNLYQQTREVITNSVIFPLKYYLKPIKCMLKTICETTTSKIKGYLKNIKYLRFSVITIRVLFDGPSLKNKVSGLRYFFKDYIKFMQLNRGNRFTISLDNLRPKIFDRTEQTPFDRHYIYHPAWAARILSETKPKLHIDISSMLSFSTIISAFIQTKFYDYRPADIHLDKFSSDRADLLSLPFENNSVESLSCMHTIEHIGLGRYGDKIDPNGDLKAIAELKRVLAHGGFLIFVVPIGKPNIIFNAHRIYSYDQIISYFADLELVEFALIPDKKEDGGIIRNASKDLSDLQSYGCGCFLFKKL